MEAATRHLATYAVTDAQSDNANNSSLKPLYRKAAKLAIYSTEFEVMDLGRQTKVTKLKNWPRSKRCLFDFTDAGKCCVERLKAQVELRFPPLTPTQNAPVLLDLLTKLFAKDLLGDELNAAIDKLTKMYRVAYKVFHNYVDAAEDEVPEETTEMIDLDSSSGTGAANVVAVMKIDEDSDDKDRLINMHANATPKKPINASAN